VTDGRTSKLRTAFTRWTASQGEVHAQEEQDRAAQLGGTRVAELSCRRPATVSGVLQSVTLRPRAGVPALLAELYDGSGNLCLVWLGRRRIAGIEPGRRLRVTGMVTRSEGQISMFNPRYELVPREED